MGLVRVDCWSARLTDPDLLDRANAFDRDGRLIFWTPEAVGRRMVESYDVLRRTPMRIWPSGFGSSMPEFFRDAPDLGELQMWLDAREEWERRVTRRANAPTAEEVSRSEEAIHWCARYLADQPLVADAISLWAACLGLRRSLRRAIRERCIRADAMLERAKEDIPDIVTIYTDDAQAAAQKIVARANVAMARSTEAGEVSRIRAGASIQFARAVREGAIVERQVRVGRPDVMPGRNFRWHAIDRRRKEAAATISDALNRAGIAVREAGKHISTDADE